MNRLNRVDLMHRQHRTLRNITEQNGTVLLVKLFILVFSCNKRNLQRQIWKEKFWLFCQCALDTNQSTQLANANSRVELRDKELANLRRSAAESRSQLERSLAEKEQLHRDLLLRSSAQGQSHGGHPSPSVLRYHQVTREREEMERDVLKKFCVFFLLLLLFISLTH